MRNLTVLADGEAFAPGTHFQLYGTAAVGLYPDVFNLVAWDLSDSDYRKLSAAKELSVLHGNSCLAGGKVCDVYRKTLPEGEQTTVAFSLGSDLWNSPAHLTVHPGSTVSGTVRKLLESSRTGIPLLSFPGKEMYIHRGHSYCGRAAECIMEALSAAEARACLVPAGLRVIPKEPLAPTLRLTGKDLADEPSFVNGGRQMILSTTMTGFGVGEEMILTYEGKDYYGLILKRTVDADTVSGPWRTELLVEVHWFPGSIVPGMQVLPEAFRGTRRKKGEEAV